MRLKRTPTLTFEYDHAVEHGVRMSKLIDELAPGTTTTTQADLGAVVEAIRGAEQILVTTHENPDGDALGSLLATQLDADSARQGQPHVPARAGAAAGREPVPAARGAAARAPRRRGRANAHRRGRCEREPARCRRGGARTAPFTVNIDHHHDNSRLGDVDLVDAAASSTGEVLRDVIRSSGSS